jgi:hypothetical protein
VIGGTHQYSLVESCDFEMAGSNYFTSFDDGFFLLSAAMSGR